MTLVPATRSTLAALTSQWRCDVSCPACGDRTKRLRVHDENPFAYTECVSCGWDDYELQYQRSVVALRAHEDVSGPMALDFNNDEVDLDELDQNC